MTGEEVWNKKDRNARWRDAKAHVFVRARQTVCIRCNMKEGKSGSGKQVTPPSHQ